VGVNKDNETMDCRAFALAALAEADPGFKATRVREAPAADANEWEIDPQRDLRAQASALRLPGRPARPALVPPKDVPHRSPHTATGLAALLHSVCHIEFNAINLALDAVWRFAGMPEAYYRDWWRVAAEEALHFSLLRAVLQSLGHDYGDFPAHDGLWAMCVRTEGDVLARMALVPRTLEARGLDATPPMQAKLRQVASTTRDERVHTAAARAVDVLEIILRDEVGHVAVGNHWYAHLCTERGLDPVATYPQLAAHFQAPRLNPPFNLEARSRAGFSSSELQALG
jgi:uncharacterized ferritin-like protein (DUF455 family)